ncbi:ubiquinone biosynthesis O-methyltransferase, mitochondrial [Euwallacea fornicatus]|uniref:ubiquinone biosynthesis O-methyltransferase, mitochondrial n=1 Tax=Euwallacea fornicatus TaxID=995702 RepID=UPI00338D4841
MIIHSFKRALASIPFQSRLHSATSTVDSLEIKQFEKFTHQWWDEFGPMKGLHALNRIRVPFIRDGLINEGAVAQENINTALPLKGLRLLDIGCGGGILSAHLSRIGAQVTGIDANSAIIDVAKQHAKDNNLDVAYFYTSVEDHSKENSLKYDVITASEIIEHVTEKEKFISACSDCLKPSGSMFITTMSKTLLANFLGIFVVEDVIDLVPKGTHQFHKFIQPHKLQRIIEDRNFETKLIHGMFYNILTNEWNWCSNTSVNYCLHAVKR